MNEKDCKSESLRRVARRLRQINDEAFARRTAERLEAEVARHRSNDEESKEHDVAQPAGTNRA